MIDGLKVLWWSMSKQHILECLSAAPWTVSEILVHKDMPEVNSSIWLAKQILRPIKEFESYLELFRYSELIVIPDEVKSPVDEKELAVHRHFSKGLQHDQDLLRRELLRESRIDWSCLDYYS